MEEEHRSLIKKNFKELVNNTNLEKLLPFVIEKNIFPSVEHFMVSNRLPSEKKQDFYMEIQSRGPRAFNLLLESLYESGHWDLHKRLNNLNGNVINPTEYVSSCNNQHNITPSYQIRSQAVPFQFPDDICLNHIKESVANQDENAGVNLMTEPLIVKVRRSGEFYDRCLHSTLMPYSTRSKHRGLLFLVNNHNFANPDKVRQGSDVDRRNLISLFEQMNFKVESFQDQTLVDMQTKLQLIQQHPDLHKIDCFFTIIMSHGEEGCSSDLTNIITADDRTIATSEIVDMFDNLRCPVLQRKPKVFIFQLCRGKQQDFGTSSTRISSTIQTDAGSRAKIASTGDVLVCHSTLPGFASHRDVYTGTWYIQTICDVFMNHAYNTDVERLLKIVADKIDSIRSEHGTMQTTPFSNIKFRDLYLHPGIYEEDGQLKYFEEHNYDS